MAGFVYTFAGLSPRDYWDLDPDEYAALRRLSDQLHKQNTPPGKEVIDFAEMARRNG